MSAFSEAIKANQRQVTTDLPLVVTPRRYAWLFRPEKERVWNERALQHAWDVKSGKFLRERSGRFSPSGLSNCPRRQMFAFMGLAEVNTDSMELEEMAEGGKAVHLDWQGDGFTEGYMADAETWVYEPSLRTGGSLDGVLYDNSLFELKSVTGIQFDKVINALIRLSWRLQIAIYFLLAESTGIDHKDLASLVVTTRDFGKFEEFRLRRNSADERTALGILTTLNTHHDEGTLPQMLEDCRYQTGTIYQKCPYKAACPLMTSSVVPEFDPS